MIINGIHGEIRNTVVFSKKGFFINVGVYNLFLYKKWGSTAKIARATAKPLPVTPQSRDRHRTVPRADY